jgi:hypothetical protein
VPAKVRSIDVIAVGSSIRDIHFPITKKLPPKVTLALKPPGVFGLAKLPCIHHLNTNLPPT